MLFEELGLEYEDVRYTEAEWPAVKEEMLSSGASLFGQLPVVVVNGKTLTQSFAIFRYFARIFGDSSFTSLSFFLFTLCSDLTGSSSSSFLPLLFTSCHRSLRLDSG